MLQEIISILFYVSWVALFAALSIRQSWWSFVAHARRSGTDRYSVALAIYLSAGSFSFSVY
jgi:hypothetical protein